VQSARLDNHEEMMIQSANCRKVVIAILVAAATSSSCDRDGPPSIKSGYKIAAACPLDAEPIPSDYLGASPDANTAIAQRVNAYLRAAKAPPLWCGTGRDVYRAVWIAANRSARLGTVTQQSGGWTATGVLFQDPRRMNADHSAAVIDKQYRRDLAAADVKDLMSVITNSDLWNAAAWRYSVETFDGDTLFVELRAQGGYRVITRAKVTDDRVHSAVRAILSAADVPTRVDD
jgi:hypothetical protein